MGPVFSRKFLLAFVAGMAVFVSLPVAAQVREPELSFYPVTSWLNEKAGGTCSISGRFNNGFDMRFSGTNGKLEAMDVNFHQDIFEKGRAYDAVLTLSGSEAQKLSAVNTAPGVLSLKLEGREEAFRTLGKASALDLAVEQNSFRFHLPGFSGPFADFERCMGGDAASAAAAAPAQKPEERFDATVNEAAIMEDEIRSRSVENAAAPLSTVSPEVASAKPAAAGETVSSAEEKALVAPAPGLVHRDHLSSDRVSHLLAEQLGEERAPLPPSAEEVLPPAQENSASVPEAVPEAPEPVEREALAEKTALETEQQGGPVSGEAVSSSISASTPEIVVHKSRIRAEADFTAPPETGASDMEGNSGDDSASSRRIVELQKTVDSLRAENAALNDELKSMVRESENERLSISSENWNLEQATMKFNEAERQIKRLGMELQKERARCDGEKKELEAMLFDPQVTNQQQLARLADLEAQLSKAKEENQLQRLQYEERLRALEAVGSAVP